MGKLEKTLAKIDELIATEKDLKTREELKNLRMQTTIGHIKREQERERSQEQFSMSPLGKSMNAFLSLQPKKPTLDEFMKTFSDAIQSNSLQDFEDSLDKSNSLSFCYNFWESYAMYFPVFQKIFEHQDATRIIYKAFYADIIDASKPITFGFLKHWIENYPKPISHSCNQQLGMVKSKLLRHAVFVQIIDFSNKKHLLSSYERFDQILCNDNASEQFLELLELIDAKQGKTIRLEKSGEKVKQWLETFPETLSADLITDFISDPYECMQAMQKVFDKCTEKERAIIYNGFYGSILTMLEKMKNYDVFPRRDIGLQMKLIRQWVDNLPQKRNQKIKATMQGLEKILQEQLEIRKFNRDQDKIILQWHTMLPIVLYGCECPQIEEMIDQLQTQRKPASCCSIS